MKKSILITFLLALMIYVSGQNPYLELTFTALENATHVQLDSIKIINRTQNCDTVLYSPDTLLLLGSGFGTNEYNGPGNGFQVFQNYPNPVFNKTTIPIYIPDRDELKIIVTDVLGRVIVKTEMELEKGRHSFRYTPGANGILFFTTQWRGETNSIRILSTVSQTTGVSSVDYVGSETISTWKKTYSATQNFTFSFGDELLYIGYTDNLQSGVLDEPANNETYTFQFATNIPCPGTPTVEYEGQVYNTIQIFSQCWLKENLNVGTMISRVEFMTDNDTIEKYCYANELANCDTFGGLYQWNEMMQYTTQHGVQGICPSGWHIPTDEEWKVLEGAVDSQYGIGDYVWNESKERGYDAGINLKNTSGWIHNGNGVDLFGFSGLPGGFNYTTDGTYYALGTAGFWWASTDEGYGSPWDRRLASFFPGIGRPGHDADWFLFHQMYSGLSVRCLKD